MDRRLIQAVEDLVGGRDLLGQRLGETSASGPTLTLADGRQLFVKTKAQAPVAMFEREIEGLQALAAVGALRVVRAYGAGGGTEGVPPFLVLEAIRPGRPRADFFELLGQGLAQLHQQSQGRAFGFADDNFLGATPQPNRWTDDWVIFWRRHRLGYQLELAREGGAGTAELDRLGKLLDSRLDDLLSEPDERPTLLHGDLWGGNYLVDETGRPVLIDPAAYFGRREADLAMTYLFGGFDARFYAAYEEAWPLAAGAAERIEVYKLYHLLNHLNLFGRSYLEPCLAILRRFA